MIFNGSYFVGLSATKELEKLSNKLTQRTEIDIYESVSKAYYTVLNTKSRIDLVNNNIERLLTLLEESKQLYDNGFIEKLDIDRITVSYNNLQSEKIKIDRLYGLSLFVLKFQIGIPLNQEIKLIGNLNEDIVENFDIDAVLLSPVFPSKSHPNSKNLGINKFVKIIKKTKLPIYALGGINIKNVKSLVETDIIGYAFQRGI